MTQNLELSKAYETSEPQQMPYVNPMNYRDLKFRTAWRVESRTKIISHQVLFKKGLMCEINRLRFLCALFISLDFTVHLWPCNVVYALLNVFAIVMD